MKDLKYTSRRPTRPVKQVVNRAKQPKKHRKPLNIRRHLKWAGKILVGAALLAGIGYGGYQLSHIVSRIVFFRLDTIEVTNSRRFTRQEVLALAGLKEGNDLLRINLRRVGEQIEKNPWVDTVKVRRYYPHTLAIEITERQPVAVVNVGFLAYLDTKGDVFKPINEGDSLDFPIITGIAEEDISRDPTGSREALVGAVSLIALLKQGGGFRLEDVSELHYDKGFGFTLFTAQGGVPIRLGTDGYPGKLARLARIYKDIQPQILGLEYIDLNYNDKIIVKKVFG